MTKRPHRRTPAEYIAHLKSLSYIDSSDPTACWEYHKSPGPYRYSYSYFNGPIPPGQMVRHKCDNPRCWNPVHLQLGTNQDNMNDLKDRRFTRPQSPGARPKLDWFAVNQIRSRFVPGEDGLALAVEFGVTPQTILSIVRNQIWKEKPLHQPPKKPPPQ